MVARAQSVETTLGTIARVDRVIVMPERLRSGTQYVGLEHIEGDFGELTATTVHQGELRSAKFAFSHGHILYGKLRPYLHKVARPDFEGVCSTDILPILPSPKVDGGYLFHLLRSPAVTGYAAIHSVGVNLPRISPATLMAMPIHLPPIVEQRRIAMILDNSDSIRRRRRENLLLLDEFLRASYASIVGSQNPGYLEWPELAIADLAEQRNGAMRTGPFGSALRHGEFTDEGEVAVLGIDNAVENRFRWAERRFVTRARYESQFTRYTVAGGDVLVTIMGTTGKSAVVPEDAPVAITTKHLAAISVDRTRAYPEFLSHAIHSDAAVLSQIAAANRGAIMSGLNLGVIRCLKIRLPPMSQQRQFHELVVRTRFVQGKCAESKRAEEQLALSLAREFFEVP